MILLHFTSSKSGVYFIGTPHIVQTRQILSAQWPHVVNNYTVDSPENTLGSTQSMVGINQIPSEDKTGPESHRTATRHTNKASILTLPLMRPSGKFSPSANLTH